ncbi:MAG: 50S ribosomal protein P1 [Candidatus Aenigmarchaeota archaeon]|nr:50S ribosomal protein P1 [Candidatus Aenigmarchaeota archaeon]
MEYIYGALLLHSAGKEINEENLKKVLTAAGEKVDDAQVKALVAALDGVDIDEAIKSAAMPVVSAAPAATEAGETKAAEEKKESKEEEEKKEEEAAEGLAGLFG